MRRSHGSSSLVRRPALVALAALLVATASRAQSVSELAELEHRIATALATERAPLLLELADRLETVDLDRAFAAAREAEKIARTPAERLAAQATLASMYRQRTNYNEALTLARDGLQHATELGNDGLRGRFNYVLARTLWSLADYPGSVASYHEAIRLGEKSGDLTVLADAHIGIVTIYTEFKEPDAARFHIEEARKYAERLGDPRRLGDFYRVYGNHLEQRKDLAGSRVAHERSRQINAESGNTRGVADALQNLGYLDELEGNFPAAQAKFEEAIAIYEKLGLKRHLTNAHRQLGRVLGRQGRTAEALRHMDISLEFARNVGAQVGIALLYRDRAIVHEVAGNLKAALADQRELQVQNEAIFGERSRQQLAVLTARFESERRQHEIDLLRRDQALKDAELARVRWQRYSLLGALALGGLAAGALVSRHRLKLASERRVLAETRAAKDAAEAADALKTRFVGIVSHDLKAPVAALIGGAEALQREAHDAETVAELARLMENEGHRMLALIRDLLDLAALEAGRLELQRGPIDLGSLVQESAAALQARALAKQQQLLCAIEGDVVNAHVSGDRARLRQVVDNLLDNAIKFTPTGKEVRIAACVGGGIARIAVQDQGPGLTPEDYVRVFQPFQKLSAQPTAGETSNGLGLSIVREIVSLHGGQVIVDSVPGQGATFSFELPLVMS
jgi:signal transduction histidine kinase